jgi:hypothetical protein
MAFVKIWFWHWFPNRKWRIVGYVDVADEIPRRIPRSGAVVVGTPKSPKWLAFDCPCNDGNRVMVNLDTSRVPVWSISSFKPLTVAPSFDIQGQEKRCHFFVINSKIQWV